MKWSKRTHWPNYNWLQAWRPRFWLTVEHVSYSWTRSSCSGGHRLGYQWVQKLRLNTKKTRYLMQTQEKLHSPPSPSEKKYILQLMFKNFFFLFQTISHSMKTCNLRKKITISIPFRETFQAKETYFQCSIYSFVTEIYFYLLTDASYRKLFIWLKL